jgi:hypothetical protein
MLWHKGWLETRFRLLFALAIGGFVLVLQYYASGAKMPLLGIVGSASILAAMLSGMLAGAGITTQPAVQATKGLHGSMMFTLSLPVSRFRLLAVRASLGWLEMAGGITTLCCGMWALFPILRATTTAAEMLEYAGVLIVCASSLHFISVLLATFLDDLWRIYGSMIAFGALWWLSNHTPLPASANVYRAMGDGSPLIAHSIPWTAMGISLGLAAILFFAALKVVQTREY